MKHYQLMTDNEIVFNLQKTNAYLSEVVIRRGIAQMMKSIPKVKTE